MDIKDNQIEILKEDIECVHKYLDDLNVPRADKDGRKYSPVGRIKLMLSKKIRIAAIIDSPEYFE